MLGLAANGRADAPRAAALSWVRAPGAEACPSGPAIAAEVERVLAGRPLVAMAQADIVVEGRVALAGDTIETTLTLVSRTGAVLGTRRLTSAGPGCDAVTGEAGLVIALMIDPDAVLRPAAPTAGAAPAATAATPSVGPPSTPEATPVPADAGPLLSAGAAPAVPPGPLRGLGAGSPPGGLVAPLCPPASAPAPWRTQLSLGPVISAGALPLPGLGVRVRAVITPPGVFPFELSGEIFAPVRAERDGAGVEVFFAQARLRACPLAREVGPWGLAACGGLDLGGLRGGGFGFAVERSAELFVPAAALAGRVQLRLGSVLRLSLGADLAVPFVRARFLTDAPDGQRRELFVTSPLSGSADLGLGLEL